MTPTTGNPAPVPSPLPAPARDSLRGLALGDGFGERWFFHENREAIAMIRRRAIGVEPEWHWTDDTQMALGVVRVLALAGRVDQTSLAREFAANFDPSRGFELLPVE
ncbi:ADP-ribosylglycohydrolase family protein [Streptomyces sp. NPDC051940]|uniref:ADP-ribosylglycohydrolase family protein n=1 Tax=Streptomyces sp. NPDC051940 TaxID=3155675 RepID=UPI00341570B7